MPQIPTVIAVTTIVSNQRNNLRAVLIGAFWGVGHHCHHLRGRHWNYSFQSRHSGAGRAQHGVVRRSDADRPGLDECSRISALDAWRINPQSLMEGKSSTLI
jgi:hypothetical protein